jgi:hypothetical protein
MVKSEHLLGDKHVCEINISYMDRLIDEVRDAERCIEKLVEGLEAFEKECEDRCYASKTPGHIVETLDRLVRYFCSFESSQGYLSDTLRRVKDEIAREPVEEGSLADISNRLAEVERNIEILISRS